MTKQQRTIVFVRETLSDRFHVSETPSPVGGSVWIKAMPKAWYDCALFVHVGPRGALRVQDCRDGKTYRGRTARTWLQVRGGKV